MKNDTLEWRNLVVAREGAPLTAPMSQQVRAGDILAIRGPNGSGKSSLLKTIAGLLRPGSGEVLWNGEAMRRHPHYPRNLVYIGHRRGIEPSMSVLAHVKFWARTFGQKELIEAALFFFDLEDIAKVPVATLSAGWQQRVALTRLILQPGSLWLLDEPTAALDEAATTLLNSLMNTRCEQGGIILIASHMPLQGDRVQTLDLGEQMKGADNDFLLH